MVHPCDLDLVIHYATRTELVATADHLVIRIVDGHRTSVEDVERLARLFDTKFAEIRLVGFLQVIRQGTPPLAPEVRRHAATILGCYGDRVVGVIALVGLGFWTASLRFGLRAFNSLLRRNPMYIESTAEAGLETLARELVGLNVDELTEVYFQVSEHMASLEPAESPA